MVRTRGPDELVELAIEKGLSVNRSQFSPYPVHKNLRPKSEGDYNRELLLWKAFEKKFPGSTPQDMRTLKQYAEFRALIMKGRLDEGGGKKATTGGVRGAMRKLCNAWERENHALIPLDVARSMAPYIEGELAEKIGLLKGKKGQKKKTFLTIGNYVHMQEFHWCDDFHDYVHEGARVDNTNLLNTHCFTSARLQEVCQAKYQDLQCIISWKDGKPDIRLKFTREICKATDVNQPEHPLAEQMKAPDGLPPPLFAQPMLHWLANIISAQAFADFHTVEQVLNVLPPKNENFYILEWADHTKDKPVFPEWSPGGPEDRSKKPASWGSQASDWAKRAGFATGLGLHAARREALIKVNDNGYSLGQVLKFASQKNTHVLVNHYLGNICSIDGAGSFLGMDLRLDLAEDFRSATMRRNPNLQFSLPAMVKEELHQSPGYTLLTESIRSLTEEIKATTSAETRARLEAQRKTAYEKRRMLENKELSELQKSQKISYETNCEEYKQGDWRRGHFKRISHMLSEERLRLERTLKLRAWPRSPEWISALHDLINLRTSECQIAYQKELRPIRGHCPVSSCHQIIEELPAKSRWNHIYRCYERFFTERSGYAKFCFLCSKWFEGKQIWKAHCQDHIENIGIPFRCNPVTFRNAVACAGYCPVHLGRTDLPAEERMRQYLDRTAWRRHISECIPLYMKAQTPIGLKCPHPKCPVTCHSDEGMWHHLGGVHGSDKPDISAKRKAISDKDMNLVEPPRKRNWIHIKAPARREETSVYLCDDKMETGPAKYSILKPGTQAVIGALCSSSESTCSSDQDNGWSPDSLVRPADSEAEGNCLSHCMSQPHGSSLHPNSSIWDTGLSRDFSEAYYRQENNNAVGSEAPLSFLTENTALLDPPIASSVTGTTHDNTARVTPTPERSSVGDLAIGVFSDDSTRMGEEEYPVDRLLGRWGKNLFYLRWLDGSYGWEPRKNILDNELIEMFEKDYKGFREGIKVLRTRRQSGKTEYRLRWTGRPESEDRWVPEKYLSPELVAIYKPRTKSQRRRGG